MCKSLKGGKLLIFKGIEQTFFLFVRQQQRMFVVSCKEKKIKSPAIFWIYLSSWIYSRPIYRIESHLKQNLATFCKQNFGNSILEKNSTYKFFILHKDRQIE